MLYHFSVIVSNRPWSGSRRCEQPYIIYMWSDPAGRTALFVLPDELKSAPESESGGVNFLAVESEKIP